MVKTKTNGHTVLRRPGFESELLAHMDALWRFGVSLTKSEDKAADLCQDTFIKALSSQHQFEPGTSLKAWLFTILRNEYFSKLRKSKREHPIDSVIVETFAGPREDLDREDAEEVTQGFVEMLPYLASIVQEQRDAVIAVHYMNFTYEESAYVFKADVGTIKSRVSRGLDRVRHLMATESIASFDLSAWATATKGVPKNHLYFPIAEAYEEIYAFLVKNSKSTMSSKATEPPQETDIDTLLRQIQRSGALDEGFEDLDGLMRGS